MRKNAQEMSGLSEAETEKKLEKMKKKLQHLMESLKLSISVKVER